MYAFTNVLSQIKRDSQFLATSSITCGYCSVTDVNLLLDGIEQPHVSHVFCGTRNRDGKCLSKPVLEWGRINTARKEPDSLRGFF